PTAPANSQGWTIRTSAGWRSRRLAELRQMQAGHLPHVPWPAALSGGGRENGHRFLQVLDRRGAIAREVLHQAHVVVREELHLRLVRQSWCGNVLDDRVRRAL